MTPFRVIVDPENWTRQKGSYNPKTQVYRIYDATTNSWGPELVAPSTILNGNGSNAAPPSYSPSSIFGAVSGAGPRPAAQGGPVSVYGYYRRDGSYVQPHYRTAPDGDRSNNWSTYPNVNPYTGKPGTRSSVAQPAHPGGHGHATGRR
jgi:hypothetical protein